MVYWFLQNQPSLPLFEYKPVNTEANEEALSIASSDTVTDPISNIESEVVKPESTEKPHIQEPMVFAKESDSSKDKIVESVGPSISASYSDSVDNQNIDANFRYPSSASHSTSRISILEPPKTKKPKNHLTSQESKWIMEEEELPHFPQSVYDSLPPFLRQVIDCSSQSKDCDMVLMG